MGGLLDKNSKAVIKQIEAHTFQDEDGEEYESSTFGGFGDYFRRKKIKLQNLDAELRSSSGDNPQIFRGIVVHVNGYTQPSLNDLHRLIVSHGGGFMQYLDGKTTVTHIIAANLTPKKAIEFRRYRIVKPAWIVDSVNAGKVLPWDEYRVISEGPGQRLLGFSQGKMVNQVNTERRGYRNQMETSWYATKVKGVADDIGDNSTSQRDQPTISNATDHHDDTLYDQPMEGAATEDVEGGLQLSGSFEVTSSLEEALRHAGGSERHQTVRLNSHSEDQTPWPAEIPSLGENEYELIPLNHITSSKSGVLQMPQKHTLEVEPPFPSKKAKPMTAEEYNAQLLSDPHIRKSSTANPNFLQQFYSESRLHHLSTWKAELKLRLQQMAADAAASQKLTKRKPGQRAYIMHVDFDSFFCAVSLKSAPDYIDKPAVVAHGSGTGSEIASCNYPAREFGVKNGMWMKQALALCPTIKVLPYDFPAYEDASRSFYKAILDLGAMVQSVSVDEALVDITTLCLPPGEPDYSEQGIMVEQEKANEIAQRLRKQIKQTTGCEVSIGIGANILLAKVALRKAKPAGQYQIKSEDVLDVLSELSVRSLPGVAYSIGSKLEEIGVNIVKDIRLLTKERLMTVLGPKTGEKIWDYSRGIDKSEVGEQVARKSVSAEISWGIRFISQAEAEEFVQNLCVELQRRLVEQKVRGRQLTMKIMKKAADAPLDPVKHLGHGKCDTYSKSTALLLATNSAEITGREAISILRSYGFSPGELRGLGVQMTKLETIKSGHIPGDSSQKKLDFGKYSAPKLPTKSDDPIYDPETPKKSKGTPAKMSEAEDPNDNSSPQKPRNYMSRLRGDLDPIDEINSPKKQRLTTMHPATAISRANASDQSAKRLNLTGTQFVLPTQIDPTVLSELPNDIRSKLMAQSSSRSTSRASSPNFLSRSASPASMSRQSSNRQQIAPLPPHFDPEVFEALPEDMKDEVLAAYSAQGNVRLQTFLPQSPRKSHAVQPKKPTPTKKRGRPVGSKNKKEDSLSTLTQSNFVLGKSADISADSEDPELLDPEFLAALPKDMRQEILAENRQKRLAKRGGLVAPTLGKYCPPEPAQPGQRKLILPNRYPRPTFTTRGLWKGDELRDTVRMWHTEFKDDGPHSEDVQALERYLRRVVAEEKNLSKARGLIKWLTWLVDEDEATELGQKGWRSALESIKGSVQAAVQERGLGALEL
jgi:DNA repair protein REV1